MAFLFPEIFHAFFKITTRHELPQLGRAVLSEHRASATLRHIQLRPYLGDAGTATGRA